MYRSGRLQIGRGRLAAAAVGFDVEGHLLPLNKAAHAGALDGRDVNEHIRATRVLRDKAIALLGVEKLDGTFGHDGPPLGKRMKRFRAVQTIRTVQIRICVCLRKAPWSARSFGKPVSTLGSSPRPGFFRIMRQRARRQVRPNRERRLYSDGWLSRQVAIRPRRGISLLPAASNRKNPEAEATCHRNSTREQQLERQLPRFAMQQRRTDENHRLFDLTFRAPNFWIAGALVRF
jgi:hypothetical protein